MLASHLFLALTALATAIAAPIADTPDDSVNTPWGEAAVVHSEPNSGTLQKRHPIKYLDNEEWVLGSRDGISYCLDVDVTEEKLQVWQCSGARNQKWLSTPGALDMIRSSALASMCVARSTWDTNEVVINSCWPEYKNQIWSWGPAMLQLDGELFNGGRVTFSSQATGTYDFQGSKDIN